MLNTGQNCVPAPLPQRGICPTEIALEKQVGMHSRPFGIAALQIASVEAAAASGPAAAAAMPGRCPAVDASAASTSSFHSAGSRFSVSTSDSGSQPVGRRPYHPVAEQASPPAARSAVNTAAAAAATAAGMAAAAAAAAADFGWAPERCVGMSAATAPPPAEKQPPGSCHVRVAVRCDNRKLAISSACYIQQQSGPPRLLGYANERHGSPIAALTVELPEPQQD